MHLSDNRNLFFGVGSGRCGTMLLANLLNTEEETLCLHEGKIRTLESGGEQVIDYLTLQNKSVYDHPETAADTLHRARHNLDSLFDQRKVQALGDIAYYYAPFVDAMRVAFPNARLIYLYRDGREFVRSAITSEIPDPTPVGWLDRKPTTKIERFISLGRLRPRPESHLSDIWPNLTAIERNTWLWSETNTIILDALGTWDDSRVFRVRFEDFVSDVLGTYEEIRLFLGFSGQMSKHVVRLIERPINSRVEKKLLTWDKWRVGEKEGFMKYGGPMMDRLGYSI